MITTLLFLLICGATGWVIEVEHIEYVFSRALEIERLCNLHKHTKEWMTGVSFMTREAENDVREVAGKVFHFIIHEPMEGSRGVEKIIARTRRMNEDWFEKLYTDSPSMPRNDFSTKFLSLVDRIEQFTPLSIEGFSTDMLSRTKVHAILAEGFLRDMLFLRNAGSQEGSGLWPRAVAATKSLAQVAFDLIRSDGSVGKRSVINALLSLAEWNCWGKRLIGTRNLQDRDTYVAGDVSRFVDLLAKFIE